MTYKKNNSNINIAYWFYNKEPDYNKKISEQKIQYLLFLTQMHYAMKYKSLLMPSLFVYSKSEIYDPTIKTIMYYGFPLMENPKFDLQTSDFLELIWQKYASQTEEQLRDFIHSLKEIKDLHDNDEIIINPLDFTDSFPSSTQKNKTDNKSKIMISQNGIVKVSAWNPRKLKNNTN